MVRFAYSLLAILLLGYLAWPYASLYGLYDDLKSEDAPGVRDRVDWLSVRAALARDMDLFAKTAANRALSARSDGGLRITLTWDSLPVANEIAGVFATPEGMIALFRDPGALRCALGAIKVSDAPRVAACLAAQKTASAPPARDRSPEGPNLGRLFEKFDYAFFTGLFSFRVTVLHEGAPLTLDFERGAAGWRLVRIGLPLERLAENEAPGGG